MTKLDDILYSISNDPDIIDENPILGLISPEEAKQQIKALMLELIGDMEQRETEDMSLKSWTPDDYKAFGKNELRNEIRQKVSEL